KHGFNLAQKPIEAGMANPGVGQMLEPASRECMDESNREYSGRDVFQKARRCVHLKSRRTGRIPTAKNQTSTCYRLSYSGSHYHPKFSARNRFCQLASVWSPATSTILTRSIALRACILSMMFAR